MFGLIDELDLQARHALNVQLIAFALHGAYPTSARMELDGSLAGFIEPEQCIKLHDKLMQLTRYLGNLDDACKQLHHAQALEGIRYAKQ